MFRNTDHVAQLRPLRVQRFSDAEASPFGTDAPRVIHAKASSPSLDQLVFIVAAGFRQHGHIGNVLTHICGRERATLEHALRSTFDPQAAGPDLPPLARNVVELLCANRGVTGRIARPFFHKMLNSLLGPGPAARLLKRIDLVFAQTRSVPSEPRLLSRPTSPRREESR